MSVALAPAVSAFDVLRKLIGPRRSARPLIIGLVALLVATSIPTAPPIVALAAAGDPFRFIYDQAGRLVSSVTATDSAKYTYDAVGNITAISRSAATTLSVIEFAPHAATVGTTVTIYGTAFSTTPSSNTVKFNGTQATVISSTTTQIVTTVPGGATTGTISVKVGNTTATSTASFTVTAVLTPTIATFTPQAAPGATITIGGTNFDTNVLYDRVTIGGTIPPGGQRSVGGTFARVTAATTTSLSAVVPPIVQSGRIVVATPNGDVTSATDFYAPPPGFATSDIGPTGRLTYGQASSFSWTVGGSVGLFLLDGTVGHRLAIKLTGSISQGYFLWVRSPDGTTLVPTSCCGLPWIDTVTLPMDGVYEVVVDAAGTGTGSLTLTPYDVPADPTTSLTFGTASTLSTTTPGQNIRFTFSGSVGQRISATISVTGMPNGRRTSIVNPDGSYLSPVSCCGQIWVDATPITQNGTHTVIIDLVDADLGGATVTLYDVGADPTAPIVAGGSPVTLSATVPGQNLLFTFSGTVGQRISASISVTGMPNGRRTSITNPDGSYLSPVSCCGQIFVDATPITQNGTHTIVIDLVDADLGSATITLYDVGADPTAPIVAGGSAVTLSATVPGQNLAFTFSGSVGQRISAVISVTGMPNGRRLGIKDPNNAYMWGPVCCSYTFTDVVTLTQNGTHMIVVDLVDTDLGSATVTLYDVGVDPTAPITAGGAAVTLTATVPGQNLAFTFNGSVGQRVSAAVSVTGMPSGRRLGIKNPSDAYMWGPACCAIAFTDVVALTQNGTHTIVVDLVDAELGSATVTLYDVGADPTAPITAGGAAVTLSASVPGQNLAFTFSGSVGQRISATVSVTGMPSGRRLGIKDPNDAYMWGPACCSYTFTDVVALTQNGIHTIVVDLVDAELGSATVTLYDVGADASGTLVIDGSAVTLSVTTPGQNAVFSFTGANGDRLTFNLTASYADGWWLTVRNPDNSILWGTNCCGWTIATFTLTQNGLHTITVDPVGTRTGDATGSLVRQSGLAPSDPTVATAANVRPSLASLGRWSQRTGPLAAPSGRVAGQVFKAEGTPLEDVVVSIGDVRTTTNWLGRFTLVDVPTGHQELQVDGSALRSGNFGLYEIGIEVESTGTTVLPFTVYLTRIDEAHSLKIASPTTSDIVLTSPRIPGLEVHIPAGTVITGEDGEVVRELTMTELSRARPPFPLPSLVETPVYFTVQPGGAYLSQPARVYYPNTYGRPPGTRAEFWHYDPETLGWYVYGEGQVSADGAHVVPDPGVGVYELTGAMIHFPFLPLPDLWAALGDFFSGGDPVDLGTGLFVLDHTDLAVQDILPLTVARTYRSQDTTSRYFGIGAMNSMELSLRLINAWQEIDLILPDEARVRYLRTSPGNDQGGVFEHTQSPTRFYKSTLHWNGASWDLVFRDGTKFNFNGDSTLAYVADRFGNRVTFVRNGGGISPHIDIVRSPNGRWMTFTYDGSDRISSVTDNIGRTVGYAYDASGRLWKVTDPNGKITEYGYDTSHRMTTIKDPRLITYLTNQYDPASGRVTRQTNADTTFFQFDYVVDGNGKVTQTNVTDPRGYVRRITFNSAGYGVTDTAGFGQPEAQLTTFVHDPASELLTSVIDARGRETRNLYFPSGDLQSTTSLYGTPSAVTTSFTYDPVWDELATVSDPLTHQTTFHYDARGNRDSQTDALSHATGFGYNNAGQLTSTTNPLLKTTSFAYQGGDLVSITDPLGRVTKRFSDAAGRPVFVTDALGGRTRTDYDVLNRVTQVIDPLGGATVLTYDDNGNRLTVKDAKLNLTQYTYNNMDRLETRKDALLRTESYAYDSNGNLVTVTDRKNQVTELRYDPLNRQTFAGFGRTGSPPNYTYATTTTYQYDNGNRLHIADNDTTGGADQVTRDYDELDRVTLETTTAGTVGYQYDAVGRRTKLSVSGQSDVFYCYDNADRLTSMRTAASCGGTAVVGFGYDNADRRTTLDLPNGTQLVYGYDDGSQLVSMTWNRSGSPVGDLAYAYDAAGRRSTMSGSYARLNLPAAQSTTIYDANNRLTKWGNKTLTYDNNGNMLGDLNNTFSWNTHDQLTAVTKTGQTLPSFTYDALGRRLTKTLGSSVTTYRYDGANTVQEKQGATVTASILTGLGVDEIFQRTEGATVRSFITDALGSTLALADSAGAVQTTYMYAPYGETTSSGGASANTSQFTGRENDADGLYYYRGRYYHPVFSRFVSEDPIGFSGGDSDLYRYVSDSPTNLTDPSGNCPICLVVLVAWTLADAHDLFLSGRKHSKADYAFFALSVTPVGRIGRAIGLSSAAASKALESARGIQKAWTHLEKAGLLGKWSGKSSPAQLSSILREILENPIAVADDVLYKSPVKVFLGELGDAPVAVFVSQETGKLITAFVPSVERMMRLFVR